MIRTPLAALGLTAISLATLAVAPAHAQDAAVSASAQAPGTAVTVAKVDMPAAGFLVIHAFDADGKPIAPASIGHVAVPAGTSENVEVEIGIQTEAGMKVLAMLHEDTGTQGIYEFGPGSTEHDKPITADGKPVVAPVPIQ